MTPLLFSKGLVDPSYWGNKFFGRIMMEELQIGQGCAHKNSRAKVIYGLDPIFDSGSTCIVKVRNQIVYGTKDENCLAEINLEITKQVYNLIHLIKYMTKSKLHMFHFVYFCFLRNVKSIIQSGNTAKFLLLRQE